MAIALIITITNTATKASTISFSSSVPHYHLLIELIVAILLMKKKKIKNKKDDYSNDGSFVTVCHIFQPSVGISSGYS